MNVKAADQSGNGIIKQCVVGTANFGLDVLTAAVRAVIYPFRQRDNVVPRISPSAPTSGSLTYPNKLVPSEPVLDFPASEGRLLNMDSDTWFLEGVLEGKESGRRYSFIVIYYVSRLRGIIPFNFYSFTLYDLERREYGTFTKYGNVKAKTGYLDLRLSLPDQDAVWTTATDKDGCLIPFAYKVNFPGVDQNGNKMSLIADVTVRNPPVPVGADTYNGKIRILKQDDTFSYFQTGVQFDGTLNWGDRSEAITGRLGHVDRQMFPLHSGINGSIDGRNLSHEWRTYFLENGLDLSAWRQFDRNARNHEYTFGGATTYDPVHGGRYFGDISYEIMSYQRVQNPPVQAFVKPRVYKRDSVLYFTARHRLSSPSLGLDIVAEPLIYAPLIRFPIEYMHGPVLLNGTFEGKPVKGIGSLELTLALYRDFEFVTVLFNSVKHLPADAVLPNSTPIDAILNTITQVGKLVDSKDSAAAIALANGQLRAEISGLAESHKGTMLQILDDLISVM